MGIAQLSYQLQIPATAGCVIAKFDHQDHLQDPPLAYQSMKRGKPFSGKEVSRSLEKMIPNTKKLWCWIRAYAEMTG
jgi:hypothetical protein